MINSTQISLENTHKIQRVNDNIVKKRQYIITDLDGTLINTFNGMYEPGLDESPCHEPLLNWLKIGGKVMANTGNGIHRQVERFFNHIPRNLRANNQVIIVANGGAAFYGSDSEGNLIEDIEFRNKGLNGKPTNIPSNQIDSLINNGVSLINSFFKELKESHILQQRLPQKYHFLIDTAKKMKDDFSIEQLITDNTSVVPRIEKRCMIDANLKCTSNIVSQIAIVGIPALLNYPLDELKKNSESLLLEIKAVNLTMEINRESMDKAVAVHWLKNSGKYDFIPEMSFSMGDKPNGNDGPLMNLKKVLCMPFVSVSNEKEPLPKDIYHIGGNCIGSAKLIDSLVKEALRLDSKRELSPIISTRLSKIIKEL